MSFSCLKYDVHQVRFFDLAYTVLPFCFSNTSKTHFFSNILDLFCYIYLLKKLDDESSH